MWEIDTVPRMTKSKMYLSQPGKLMFFSTYCICLLIIETCEALIFKIQCVVRCLFLYFFGFCFVFNS